MRSTLLPDSMLTESWISLVDSVDKVWDTLIDKKIQALSTIHYSHKITNKSQLIDYSSHEILDRSTLIQKIRSLGFDISVTNSVSTNSLYRMAATLGQQSRAKSSPTKIANYVNYVFNTKIHLSQVCTTDFITFEENIPRSNTKAANASKPYYPTFAYIVYIDKDHLAETDISSLISNLRKLLPVRISIYYVKVYKSNQAPTALTIPDQSVNQGAVFTLDVSPYFVDPNISDSLTYSVTGGPAGTSITGSIITTDAVIDLSTTSIVVYATDTGGLSIAQSFNLSVESATDNTSIINMSFPSNPSSSGDPPILISEYGTAVVVNSTTNTIDYLTLASTPLSGLRYTIANASWDISSGFKLSMNYKFIENTISGSFSQSSVNTIFLQTSSSYVSLTLGFYFYRDNISGLITAQRIDFGGNYGPTFLDIPPVTSSTLFDGNPHLLDIYVTPTSVTIQVDHLTIQTTSISVTPITEVSTNAMIEFSTGGGESTLPTGSSISNYIVVTTPT